MTFQRRRSREGFTLSPMDAFDSGASSGYGSPGMGGTPMSSPAPQIYSLPSHVQHALCDRGFCYQTDNVVSLGPTVIETERHKNKVHCN